MTETKRVTSDDLVAKRTFEVQTSLGTVVCRRLPLLELFALRGEIMDVAAMSGDTKFDLSQQKSEDIKRISGAMERVLAASILDPVLALDGPGARPSDFPIGDMMVIFGAIVKASGFTQEAAARVRP